MGNFKDLTGQKFGNLTVIERAENHITSGGNRVTSWKCQCDCGNICIVFGTNLKNGRVKSCGCTKYRLSRGMVDLTGKKYGMLTVTSEYESRVTKGGRRRIFWKCICDCEKITWVDAGCLTSGNTKSCGCVKINFFLTHGLSETRLYNIWTDMKQRCYNSNSKAYEYYGGRGIVICDEWKEDFTNFYNWANENGYSDELTIERKDCNGNYEPSNCCWITQFEQHGNTRRNKFIEHNNEKHTVAEWARIKNMHPQTIWSRIRLGWNIDDAIEKPIMSKGEKNKC